MPPAIRPMPAQESSRKQNAQRERSYEGRGRPAKPSACSQELTALVEHSAMRHQRPGRGYRGVKEQCDFSFDAI
jgi:hypothetical protein